MGKVQMFSSPGRRRESICPFSTVSLDQREKGRFTPSSVNVEYPQARHPSTDHAPIAAFVRPRPCTDNVTIGRGAIPPSLQKRLFIPCEARENPPSKRGEA